MNRTLLGNLLILGGLALGILTGFVDIDFLNKGAEVSSDLFLRLLKLISLPIIFCAITSTITGMQDPKEMRRMGRKILTYTVGTTLVAAAIALLLFVIIKPASGTGLPAIDTLEQVSVPSGSYLSFMVNIVPANFFGAFVNNNVVGVAFIGLLLSIATLFLPTQQKTLLHELFSALFAVMLKVTSLVIKLIPLAIWAFVTLLILDLRTNGTELGHIFLYLACVMGANLIQGIVVLPAMLKVKKISPLKAFRAMGPALTLAFFSKSSTAALPVTMRSLEKGSNVSQRVSRFTLPLCSVVNMNGCAAFILTTVLFVSMLHGVLFTPLELIGWIFFATIAAIGNAGVPMGCFFLASAFLVGMDIPLYTMGLILPFYTIIDMLETALNVWSDACITLAVDKDLKTTEPIIQDAV